MYFNELGCPMAGGIEVGWVWSMDATGGAPPIEVGWVWSMDATGGAPPIEVGRVWSRDTMGGAPPICFCCCWRSTFLCSSIMLRCNCWIFCTL